MTTNDNFKNESDFLLNKAKDILSECKKTDHESCSLMNGGSCPLIGSAITSFRDYISRVK